MRSFSSHRSSPYRPLAHEIRLNKVKKELLMFKKLIDVYFCFYSHPFFIVLFECISVIVERSQQQQVGAFKWKVPI